MQLSRIYRNYGTLTLLGYDEAGKQVKEVVKFPQHFYIDTDHIAAFKDFNWLEFTDEQRATFDGKIATKVIVKKQVKEYREMVRNSGPLAHLTDYTYMADFSQEHLWLIENQPTFSKKRRIWYFDIETHVDKNADHKNKPAFAEMPVTSIQIYDSIDERYYIFGWHPEETQQFTQLTKKEQDNITYFLANTEQLMLEGFIQFMKKWSPDVLTGWYSEGYDIPYMIKRLDVLGMDANRLSPQGYVRLYQKDGKDVGSISGIDHVDMIQCLQDLYVNLPNWKLATAAKTILGDGVADKLDDVTWRDWLPNFRGFLRYGIRDVEILHLIDKKMQIFDLYFTLQDITKVPALSMLFSKSMVVDSYICSQNHKEMVFPTRKTVRRRPYAGAYVFDPQEPGLHKDVFVCDYASLYPTTMMAFNLSPETFLFSKEICESLGKDIDEEVAKLRAEGMDIVDTGEQGYDEIFGGRYVFMGHKTKVGIIPKMLKKLYAERLRIKSEMKQDGIEKDHYNALDKHQNAVKLILNSAYGALGFNYFRLCSYEAADACTFFARQALKDAASYFEKEGHAVLYGDTDSVFVKGANKSLSEFEVTANKFNQHLTGEFINQYHPTVSSDFIFNNLEVEKDLEFIYFSDVKKRYYSIVRGSGKKYIRGMNIIRKDTPEFLKGSLNEMSELLLRGELTVEWLEDLKGTIKERPLSEIGIAKAFSKGFDQYDKTMPYHVKAAQVANKYLGTNITHMDNPYLFYIKNRMEVDKRPADRSEVICLNSEDLGLFETRASMLEIDWDRYFDKQVLEQLDEFNKIESVANLIRTYRKGNDLFFQLDLFQD